MKLVIDAEMVASVSSRKSHDDHWYTDLDLYQGKRMYAAYRVKVRDGQSKAETFASSKRRDVIDWCGAGPLSRAALADAGWL